MPPAAPTKPGLDPRALGFPLGAAALSLAIAPLVPLIGPLLVALALGAVIANSPLAGRPALAGQDAAGRLLLRLGVVALGLRLPVGDVLAVGGSGLAVVVVTVTVTYLGTLLIGDRLGLEHGFVTLVAAGFSICGAAAIAAVEGSARANRRDVALAVALVTVYGSAMIVLVPWLAAMLGLTERQAALWAGASIHEVAQVAAAASLVGSGAVALAMTVKLGRVLLLAPVNVAAGRRGQHHAGGTTHVPIVPWFVAGFAVAVAIRSSGILGATALEVADLAATVLLAAGMFGLGLGIRARELWPVPARALVLATLSTGLAAATSLALVMSSA